MKFKNVLLLAMKNISQKRSAYIKVVVSVLLVFLFTYIVIFYSSSLALAYSGYELHHIQWARYFVYGELSADQEARIREFEQVSSITFELSVELNSREETSIVIGGREYQVTGKGLFGDFIDERSDSCIPENKIKACNAANEKIFIHGMELKNKDDVLISERVLSWFDIPASDELLGKSIEIKNSEYTIKGNICGILSNHAYNMGYFICYLDDGMAYNMVDISLKSFAGNEEFFAEMEELFGDEIDHDFLGSGDLEQMQIINGQEVLCSKVLSLICAIIVVICFAYVTCNQFYLLQKNSVYYGVLKASGVSNHAVFAIHMMELVMLCVVALVIAFAASIGVFFVLQRVLAEVFYIDLLFSVGTAIGYFGLFVVGSVLFSFAITVFIYKRLLSKPTIYLLKK